MPYPPLAVCSWSLRPSDPAALAASLAPTGLRHVQLALVPLVEDPAWAEAPRVLAEEGIEVVSGMLETVGEDYSTLEAIARTGGVRPDATWDANRTRAEQVARVAGEHGLELVTFHAGFLPEDKADPERGRLIDRLRTIAGIFEAAGVAVGFETGQETAETLSDVLAELDCPNVGVNFDPANMILYGKGDPVAAVLRLGPMVRQVHIKDAVPTEQPGTWGAEVAAGEGAVDWPAFFAALDDVDPDLQLVVEREAGAERGGDIRGARALVERLRA